MINVAVIGSGFSSLSTACFLAKNGYAVTVFEKNSDIGGRARSFNEDGYTFDMGPSWYWMPDVFEKFFNSFGKSASDYYNLKRLSPSYRIFDADSEIDLPSDFQEILNLFESLETGSSVNLEKFLDEAKYKYQVGINQLVYQPGISLMEYIKPEVLKGIFSLNLFGSIAEEVRKKFKNSTIRKILEFPSLFLGAKPEKTPGLYSLMNYADLVLGTWYPMGGMYKIVEAMTSVALELGVKFETNAAVKSFNFNSKSIESIITEKGTFETDIVVSGADYAHTESLLPEDKRNYSKKYWDSRTLAPSSLIYYLGINKELPNLLHHNLFFDKSFAVHATEIYDEPKWPSDPLFYICAPSKTDPEVAPSGCENIFILMPLATGIEDSEEQREIYFNRILDRLENRIGEKIRENIVFKKSYSINNFITDYNSLRGNAYGLANTLKQTAILKPSILNKSIPNLFYTGQLTVPGPGVPPSIISGEVVSEQVKKYFKIDNKVAV